MIHARSTGGAADRAGCAAMTTQDSKGRKIGYWVTTGLVALGLLGGGTADALAVPDAIAIFEALGYPTYLLHLIGVAKILAAITILLPKFPRLKEWAYAGIVFDLIGAGYSHIANGDTVGEIMPPLVLCAIALTSWYLRPADRKLPDAKPA
jgi:uncharacterized membrane protein YphA (DoxX/SURF4 family)